MQPNISTQIGVTNEPSGSKERTIKVLLTSKLTTQR